MRSRPLKLDFTQIRCFLVAITQDILRAACAVRSEQHMYIPFPLPACCSPLTLLQWFSSSVELCCTMGYIYLWWCSFHHLQQRVFVIWPFCWVEKMGYLEANTALIKCRKILMWFSVSPASFIISVRHITIQAPVHGEWNRKFELNSILSPT